MPPAVTSAPLQTENFSGFDFTILPVPASHMMKSKPEKFSDRKSTRLNSSHVRISYAVFCLKKKKKFLKAVVANRLHLLVENEKIEFGGSVYGIPHRLSTFEHAAQEPTRKHRVRASRQLAQD